MSLKQFKHVKTESDKRTHLSCVLRLHKMHCFSSALFSVISEHTQHILSKSSSESDHCFFLDFDFRPLLVEGCGSNCMVFFGGRPLFLGAVAMVDFGILFLVAGFSFFSASTPPAQPPIPSF